MPIHHPKTYGPIISGYEVQGTGTAWKEILRLTFASSSWASATIYCVFSDSDRKNGAWTAAVHGYNAHGGTTNYVVELVGTNQGSTYAFADNFQFGYVSASPNVQKLEFKSGGSTDAIQCLLTIVTSARDGDTIPVVTLGQ